MNVSHVLFYKRYPPPHTHTRPKWVILTGIKYSYFDYVLIGWQDDDLPLFGRVHDILVFESSVSFKVRKYETLGINRHYHSFCIKKRCDYSLYWNSELLDYYPYQGQMVACT